MLPSTEFAQQTPFSTPLAVLRPVPGNEGASKRGGEGVEAGAVFCRAKRCGFVSCPSLVPARCVWRLFTARCPLSAFRGRLRNFYRRPRNFLRRPRNFLRHPRNFLRRPRNFLRHPRNFLRHPRNFLGRPRNFLRRPRNFLRPWQDVCCRLDLSRLSGCL
jgi:hypothetical protein